MDSVSGVESEVKLGEKRSAEDGGEGGGPLPKKAKKVGLGVGLLGDMKKVAEMVLFLAAMGKMRGGRVPTQVEKDIMLTAREKLAEVCQHFPPKDVFPRDVFGAIIEDLGLNGIKDQRLQFRPPKVTIAEKYLLSKRKMEKSEDLSAPPAISGSQRLPTHSAVATENRGPPHTVRVLTSDKSNHMPFASGSFQTASPFSHATNSTSLPYQLPTSEVRPGVSGGLPSNHLGAAPVAITRTDRPHFSVDRRSNGPSHVAHLQANNSGDHPSGKTPTWSVQLQPAPSTKVGTEAKVPMQTVIKTEGPADAKSGMVSQVPISKPFMGQSTSGHVVNLHQHPQVMNTIQPTMPRISHAEIVKIVQKVLQPHSSDLPVWTPPSRDYMNQALLCQVCKSTINDVDSVIVCDACEKGFHLKCLQINTAKGIPKGDWHCRKCLQLSHGKPLPPKYGRVMRNVPAPKGPTSTSSVQSSSSKKPGSVDEKINQQKTLPNGSTTVPSVPSVNMVGNSGHPSSALKVENPSEARENSVVAKGKKVEGSSETSSKNTTTASDTGVVSPSVPSVKDQKMLDVKPLPVSETEMVNSLSISHSRANTVENGQPGVPHDVLLGTKPCDDQIMDRPLNGSCREEDLCDHLTKESTCDDRGTKEASSAVTSTSGAGSTEIKRPSSDIVNGVNWVGDTLKVDGNNFYYHSCSINGVVYKLQDHVLVRLPNDKLIPSKLQSLWEDSRTNVKWMTVNRCYFPGDLPEAVGRPCSLESSEVFESTCGCTIMADSIQGLCEVLPPSKFAMEREKRASLGVSSGDSLRPLYLCKWIYDEPKGLFRDVSS